jgi:hypothetical protein
LLFASQIYFIDITLKGKTTHLELFLRLEDELSLITQHNDQGKKPSFRGKHKNSDAQHYVR